MTMRYKLGDCGLSQHQLAETGEKDKSSVRTDWRFLPLHRPAWSWCIRMG